MAEGDAGGCLKVLAIVVVALGVVGGLFWKLSQASGAAAAVAENVSTPYLQEIKAGRYAEALEQYGTPQFRERVTEEKLKGEYSKLTSKHGALESMKLIKADEHSVVGEESYVRATYQLKFEKAEETVVYDIVGEGDDARIRESYERTLGRDTLTASPR